MQRNAMGMGIDRGTLDEKKKAGCLLACLKRRNRRKIQYDPPSMWLGEACVVLESETCTRMHTHTP